MFCFKHRASKYSRLSNNLVYYEKNANFKTFALFCGGHPKQQKRTPLVLKILK
jgi:hypothetical protein